MRVSRLGALVVAVVLLVNSSPLVEAQLGIETQNASGDSCECSPACEGDVGGGGCRGRVVVREDCPCCKVCSQQKGTKCSHPSRPCDTQFGLICSVEGICEAEYSCQTDSECPDDRFCLGEVCVDPCPILTPCQGALKGGECVSTGHRPGCQCPEGTIANSAGNVCVSNNGTTEEEAATTNESAITFQEKVEGKLPAGGLKVLAISHNSSTLVLPSTKGGDIYYKAFKGSQDWQRVSVEAGQDSLVLKGLQPNTQYTLKWSGESGGSAKITIDTQEGCKHKNVSYGVSQEWSDGCQHRCSCRPGGIPNCQPRCLFVTGDIKDPLCTERPSPEDPECCVVYDCKKTDEISVPMILNEEQAPGQPKLLVTEKTHNSVTIAWDDFRPRTYEGGYVVEYREGAEPSAAVPNEEPWMMKELPTGPHQPKLTVENLKPSTIYQVRVSIYDDTDHTGLGESTETLTVRTEPGCMYHNESYTVGEFFRGCEERCMCYVNGDIKCFERCSLPYFRAGSFKDDPLCRELPNDRDDCCVIVQCATSNASVRQGINATSFTEVSYNQCTNVVCGANAECVSRPVEADNLNPGDSEVTLGYCRCLKGFVGDAADLRFGCVASPSADQMEGGCTYKNRTYRSGDTFYDGCDYRCSCNDNSEIECEPRCEFPHANGTKTEPGCEYIPDPEDTCCKLRVCNSTSEAATDAARAPSLISDGCTEGNVTYAKNEKFYKGCQTQCTCIGFGDVECVPRCPPLKVMSDTPKRCETLPDPLDACCLITVCDQETPDVMKANITEMEKEMMMMKESMKNMTQMEKDMLMKRMSELEKEMMMKNISEMEMTLQKMIEEQDKLMSTNISEMEKEMIRNNMTEIEMMMRAVAEMEKEITTTNMTDIDRAILKLKLMEMQNKLTEEMSTDENGEMDEHALMHVLGLEHSHAQHMDDMKNHTHTHEDGTTHTHPGGHLPHSHDDMENHTHTHEDGTTHTHPGGHLPHSHDDMENHTHTHEDGTTHTHPGGHIPHSHDDMENHTHTHEDGTTHTHPVGHIPHSHNDMNDMDAAHSHTHTHDDNTTHSHPHDHMDDSHTHDLNVEHGHEHTHEDGTTHTHPHEHMDESHNHTHDDMDENHNHTHMHEDGTIHSHPHEHVDDSHNHTHDMDNHTHTHEDGMTHSHPHDHMDESHNHTHDMDEHTHEDGTTHSHPHDHMDESHNHTHDMDDHTHTHEDGTTHSHPHDHMDESHNHTHDMDAILSTHTHEDGTEHSHPHENMDDHNHEHTHEDGSTHSHPHEHMDDSHNHTHEMDDGHDHVHFHADGTTHSHPHEHTNDSHVHEHDMQEGKNHTHMHENGMVHSHPDVDEFHNHTQFNSLKKNRAEDLGTHDLNILSVMPVNTTAVKMTVGVSENVMSQILSSEDQYVKVFYSPDSLTWMEKNVSVGDVQVMNMEELVFYINDLQPSTSYQFRISYHDFVSTTSKARLLGGTMDTDDMDTGIDIDTSAMCSRDGRYYKPGEEFYQGCSHSCICSGSLEIHCAAIECPVTFGLELIDPNCLEWDIDTDYVPTPPKCCPQVKCIESAACHYMGQIFNNYDTIPRELTGCSKVCTCNYGNVTCRDLCDSIPSMPPPDLNCAPEDAVRITLPGETCCETWQCSAHSVGVDGIAKPHITSMDPNTARLSFSTPAHYQGLPGELLIRYTKMPVAQPDPMTWTQDVLVQSGNTINHSKWDYSVGNLDPATQYTMQLVLTVLGANSVTSPVFSYTTMDEAITSPPTTTPLPRLEIDAELYASEITKTSAKVSWRHFDDYELQYIDGVQVKYTEKDKLIPKFSQLFHRDNNQMDLRGLQPGNNYTVDLVFMTHKNQTTQVSNTDPITFTTLPEEDPYAFDITVVAGKVSSQTAELTYSGVPEPEEKYVNVYRAVYLREVERIDAQSFKIPKIGQEKKIFLNDLKPDVEYQVWLEAYLSNGRNKKSNVITIKTRAGRLPTPERSEVDPSVPSDKEGEGYYPALVAVAIIAAIACIGFLGLLIILLRKQNHAKAHINSSRNNAAYDNPSYKVGDNGYDMEMNGIKGSGNGATHMEEP